MSGGGKWGGGGFRFPGEFRAQRYEVVLLIIRYHIKVQKIGLNYIIYYWTQFHPIGDARFSCIGMPLSTFLLISCCIKIIVVITEMKKQFTKPENAKEQLRKRNVWILGWRNTLHMSKRKRTHYSLDENGLYASFITYSIN